MAIWKPFGPITQVLKLLAVSTFLLLKETFRVKQNSTKSGWCVLTLRITMCYFLCCNTIFWLCFVSRVQLPKGWEMADASWRRSTFPESIQTSVLPFVPDPGFHSPPAAQSAHSACFCTLLWLRVMSLLSLGASLLFIKKIVSTNYMVEWNIAYLFARLPSRQQKQIVWEYLMT